VVDGVYGRPVENKLAWRWSAQGMGEMVENNPFLFLMGRGPTSIVPKPLNVVFSFPRVDA
jgi:hypothetical protein